MESMPSIDKGSEGSECAEPFESDTVGPSSTSGASELKNNRDFLIHKVTKFDTLAGLAIRYGLSVYDIKKANGLTDDRGIFGRESLVIPLSPDQGSDTRLKIRSSVSLPRRVEKTSISEWMEACCSKDPPRRFKSHTSQNSPPKKNEIVVVGRWSSFVPVDDSSERTISEIELELLDEERAMHRRQEALMQRHKNLYPSHRHEPVPPKPHSGSISEYFTMMATSLAKTTESLFSGDASKSTNPSESLFGRMKQTASRSSLFSGMVSRMRQGETDMGLRKPSEGNLSIQSGKESMKID